MKIGLFTMGGTIAMRRQSGGGVAPEDDADALFSSTVRMPGIEVERYDLTLKPSASIDLADVAALASALEVTAAAGMDGAVVTHGTDTLEETAFALELMLGKSIPVVVTGAMRSADSVGADGPANLEAAMRIAADPAARDHGVTVLFGDEIHAAHLVHKVHSARPHAFTSEPLGPIGRIVEGEVSFEMASRIVLPQLSLGGSIPVVPILQVGMDLEPETILAFDSPAIDALIIAGVGGGHVSARAAPELQALAHRKPVVISSRVGMGPTLQNSYAYCGGDIDLQEKGLLNAGRWRPNQARILLQLAISCGQDLRGILGLTLD